MRSRLAWVLPGLLQALLLAGCEQEGGVDTARGTACTTDADCGELACVADPDTPPEDLSDLPLVCDTLTDAAALGGACEVDADCGRGVCLLAGGCAGAPCESDADCDAIGRCQTVFARTGGEALQRLRACVAQHDLPPEADVQLRVEAGALSGERDAVTLAAPEADTTTTYVLEHLSPNWPEGVLCRPPLCVAALRTGGSDGEVLFDAAADYAREPPPRVPVARGDHVDPAVIRVGAEAAAELSDAGLETELDSEVAGDLRVTRIAGGGGRRLDLNVFYLGGLAWEPDGDRGPPLLADALERVDEILGQADIVVGEVRQIAVPGQLPMTGLAFPEGDQAAGFQTIMVRFGVYAELPELFRLSAGAGNSAINLFFVQDLLPRSGDGEPEAEAGGIPGPPGMQGTGGSGIAIATDMMAGDADALGRTLAHELAHYLGLFHTSEADGRVLDNLEDTPECRPSADIDGDGLGVQDCAGLGADNLMFWAKTDDTTLTPQQREVLRSSPLLR
ncbi:MAG: hypothetical protein PVI30_20250 [Myxococcales bacterium]|jgi:hypothetical protein